jgi:hypothetical protein
LKGTLTRWCDGEVLQACIDMLTQRAAAWQMRAGEPVGEPIHGAPAVDADRRLYANYYVRPIKRLASVGLL